MSVYYILRCSTGINTYIKVAPDTYRDSIMNFNNNPKNSIRKVNRKSCGDFNKLTGTLNHISEVQEILAPLANRYLSAIGQQIDVDGSDIGYQNASYLYTTLEDYQTITGEQIVAWQYRKKPSGTWGKLNFSTMNALERAIVENNICAIGTLKFENGQMKEEFLKDLRERVKPKDENEFKRDLETLKESAKRHAVCLQKTNAINSTVTFDSQLNTATGWIINIKSRVLKKGRNIIFMSPELTIHPKEKRIKKSK